MSFPLCFGAFFKCRLGFVIEKSHYEWLNIFSEHFQGVILCKVILPPPPPHFWTITIPCMKTCLVHRGSQSVLPVGSSPLSPIVPLLTLHSSCILPELALHCSPCLSLCCSSTVPHVCPYAVPRLSPFIPMSDQPTKPLSAKLCSVPHPTKGVVGVPWLTNTLLWGRSSYTSCSYLYSLGGLQLCTYEWHQQTAGKDAHSYSLLWSTVLVLLLFGSVSVTGCLTTSPIILVLGSDTVASDQWRCTRGDGAQG